VAVMGSVAVVVVVAQHRALFRADRPLDVVGRIGRVGDPVVERVTCTWRVSVDSSGVDELAANEDARSHHLPFLVDHLGALIIGHPLLLVRTPTY